jgi:hypothetical protein
MKLSIMFQNFANTLLNVIPTFMNWIYISNVLSEDKEINTNAFFSRNLQVKKLWILNLKCIH